VAAKRKYTGTSDGPASGKRAGTEEFVRQINKLSGGKLWNNGTWVVRNMAGKQSLSVHATGRAMDLSYRGKQGGRKEAQRIMKLLVQHNALLQVEMILDYFPTPHGRGWRCDRQVWSRYTRKTITGAPGGDWIHVEISPAIADSPQLVKTAFASLTQV